MNQEEVDALFAQMYGLWEAARHMPADIRDVDTARRKTLQQAIELVDLECDVLEKLRNKYQIRPPSPNPAPIGWQLSTSDAGVQFEREPSLSMIEKLARRGGHRGEVLRG